jgi:hypothetical protein
MTRLGLRQMTSKPHFRQDGSGDVLLLGGFSLPSSPRSLSRDP